MYFDVVLPHHKTISGRVVLLCIFHAEKTPSLSLWPNGNFYCHGCKEQGFWEDYPELTLLMPRSALYPYENPLQLELPFVPV